MIENKRLDLEYDELPSDIQTEQAVLGTLLMNGEYYAKVAEILTPDCFHEEVHRRIYQIIDTLCVQNQPCSPLTVKNYLPKDQDLGNGLTVSEYLARLAREGVITTSEIRGYAVVLADMRNRRALIGIANDMREAAYNAPATQTSAGMISRFQEDLANVVASNREQSEYRSFSHASRKALQIAENAYAGNGRLVGLSTGLTPLNDALGGLINSDLIILAGRPGMGKTSLATNIAFSVAKDLHYRIQNGEHPKDVGVVGFVSLEMSESQLAARILSEQSLVPGWKIRRGFALRHEIDAYANAANDLDTIPLEIDPTGGISIQTLKLRARSLKKRKGLALLVVDYLQLLSGSERNRDNRVREVTEITIGLKEIAKELDVPVLALSQLSRDLEKRDDRRPMLSDLRESGSIEQDADHVWFIYREEYYLKKMKAPEEGSDARYKHETKLALAHGVAEIIVAKNRHGPEDTVRLGFNSEISSFCSEVEPREDVDLEPERAKREKAAHAPKEAVWALDLLHDLSMSRPAHVTNWEDIPLDAACVDYGVWRDRFAASYLDPDATEAERNTFVAKTVKFLMGENWIGRGGGKGAPIAWVTDKGMKVLKK